MDHSVRIGGCGGAATKMNNGWSQYHQKKAMEQIDKLSQQLDGIKQDLARARSEKMFKNIVARVPGETTEKRPTPNAQRPTSNTEDEQIGGS